MRVIAGTFRSRQLKSLKGLALRPTSDRLRETLFNVLAPRIKGSRFIDGFAGTGAIGIEAISRGATEVIFIENYGAAATLIQKNLDSLDIRSGVKIITADALRALQRLADAHKVSAPPYDIVFLDPPYAAAEDYRRVLSFLGEATFLADSSLVIAEHRPAFDLPERFGHLQRFRVLRQGDASLSFYRFTFLSQTNFAQTKDSNASKPLAPCTHLFFFGYHWLIPGIATRDII
jgi:16S rRNA (guanine(966)-N(2))-methyltransferase RsmD